MPPSPGRIVDATDDLIKRLGSKPIRAYHGSPYDFDRFDASKIGTGEGAQAYGHGLYFAGNEGVARSYRDDLSRGSFMVEGAGTPWTESTMDFLGVRPRARVTLRMAVRDGADPLDRLLQAQSGVGPLSAPWNEYQDAIELLRGAKGKLVPNKGRMYEVQIAHPEETLLDWDAPMASQSQYVQERLAAIDPKQFGLVPDEMPGPYGGLRWRTQRNTVMGTPVQGKSPDDLTFWDTHRDNRSAHTAYADLSAMTQGTASASQALRQAGIPGIRYLDQGSRAAGDGTRNYVMFPGTEDSITILRKYGLLPPLAGAAAMQGDDQP